jgi:hypothetical protein
MYIFMSQFTTKQNLNMLWEVLLTELNINASNKTLTNKLHIIFESNIAPFTKTNHKTNNILELNKIFLSQVLIAIERLMPNLKNETQFKKINITNEEIYKIEDIQTLRQNNFEIELEEKRKELDTYLTPQKPKEMDFSFNSTNEKIKSMDSLIADKLKQRTNEIEPIKYDANVEKWLTSKETSTTTTNKLKHVSWEDEDITNSDIKNTDTYYEISQNEATISIPNIFAKLKKNPVENETKPNSYDEQPSQPLPNVKQEAVTHINSQNSKSEPIIPKNEIVKQLNDMNVKIDNLYSMIDKLTSLINDKLTTNSS